MTGCAMTDVCGVLGIPRRTAYYVAGTSPRPLSSDDGRHGGGPDPGR